MERLLLRRLLILLSKLSCLPGGSSFSEDDGKPPIRISVTSPYDVSASPPMLVVFALTSVDFVANFLSWMTLGLGCGGVIGWLLVAVVEGVLGGRRE